MLHQGRKIYLDHISRSAAEEAALAERLGEEDAMETDPQAVLTLMNEGVVEDPTVDHDPEESKSQASLLDVEPPSQAEIESGAARVVAVSKANDEHTREDDDEFEEAPAAAAAAASLSSAQSASSSAAASSSSDQPTVTVNAEAASTVLLSVQGGQVRLRPQVKGPKAFKMVNSHFLALIDAWTQAGWTRMSDSAFTSGVSLILTKPVTVVPGSRGKMISQISSSACIGGTKGAQLSCRSKFAAASAKCTFDSLRVSPSQFDMWRAADCERFFEVALRPENKELQWIGKLGASYHGRHITIYKGVTSTIKTTYGKCKLNRESGGGYIMQKYVANPALIGGRKFDLRTFMLIASTEPYLVFYHKGFIRRSATAYSSDALGDKLAHITNAEAQDSDDHFAGFDFLQKALSEELNFPPDYMSRTFKSRTKHVTNFVFQAARAKLKRRTGAFMLFGLDWMVDRSGGVHLLEANGYPVMRHYPNTDDLTPQIWRDMATLLTLIHMDPDLIESDVTAAAGFKHGGWEIVFSEPEEKLSGRTYDPCMIDAYESQCKGNGDVCAMW